MSLAIRIVSLTKRFPRTAGYRDLWPFRRRQWVTAIDNLTLDIPRGQIFGLLGPNGAGKTTLVKTLCTLILPTSGTAQVLGYDVERDPQVVKEKVGLVSSEERSFYWRLTARQNLEFFASLYNLARPEMRRRIDSALELVGLTKEADIRFQNYSTGMRQRMGIARALLSKPDILFVDEPTRSLDPVAAQAVRHLFKEMVAQGKRTVVLATHNMNEAEELCDQIAILSRGRLVASGSVSQLGNLFQKDAGWEILVRHLDEELLPHLRLIPGIEYCAKAAQEDGLAKLEVSATHQLALAELLRAIVSGGGQLQACRRQELPLEQIFIQALRGSNRKGD